MGRAIGLVALMSFAIGRWVWVLDCVDVRGSDWVAQVLIVRIQVVGCGRLGYRIFRSFVS